MSAVMYFISELKAHHAKLGIDECAGSFATRPFPTLFFLFLPHLLLTFSPILPFDVPLVAGEVGEPVSN